MLTWQGLFLGAHCRRAGFVAALARVVVSGMAVRAAWSVDRTAGAALVIPAVSSMAFVALQAANLALDPPAPRRGG